jgi:putative ABC transport system permease protein
MGILIGLATSRLFAPFFQIALDAASQVPPFKIVFYSNDRLKIYILMGMIMALGLSILAVLISRIKISQAVKLGED